MKTQYGTAVSTPRRRYGHGLWTPFWQTPFPRFLFPSLGRLGGATPQFSRLKSTSLSKFQRTARRGLPENFSLSLFLGVPLWLGEIWYTRKPNAFFLIYFFILLCWVKLKQGRVQRGYGTNSRSLQCWGYTYSTWRSSWFSNVRNQESAPLRLDRLRDLAEVLSKTEKGTTSLSARVLCAATTSIAGLRKSRP